MWLAKLYWTRILSIIIEHYLANSTVCIVWNDDIEFHLALSLPIAVVNIKLENLEATFTNDVVPHSTPGDYISNGLTYNAFVEKLRTSIQLSHCESFVVFQTHILAFFSAFKNASTYAIWRSERNKFIFALDRQQMDLADLEHPFFVDQSSILIIESNSSCSHLFELRTNKFVGPRHERPSELYTLDSYNAENETFAYGVHLFPDKIKNLQGREVILAAFDYRPDVVLKYYVGGLYRDLAYKNAAGGAVTIDGTDVRYLLTFCEMYNCTVVIDSSEADDWGIAYQNMTGDGVLGMIAKGKAEVGMSAMYTWYTDYIALDMSMYLGRSGVTCLVPTPRRLASWLLPVEPFEPALWGFVVICLCVEILALYCFRHFQPGAQTPPQNWYKSFSFAFATTLKLFISQSDDGNVYFVPLRVMLCACFLNDIVISSIYGGGLASILTVPSFELAADTLERMQAFGLTWAANSEAWATSLRGTNDTKTNQLLENFRVYSSEKLADMAKSEYMAFTLERLPFGHFAVEDYLTRDVLQHMKIMQDDIYFQYTVAFASRLWPMLERFNALIYMWHSSGFDKYWEWNIVAENLDGDIQKQIEASQYTNLEDMGPVKLSMANFVGILLIWLLGISLAAIAFIFEMLLAYFQSKQNGLASKLNSCETQSTQ